MPSLIVVTRDGAEHALQGQAGMTIMEVIRDGGIDELLALCGGCCSCATCHVHVDDRFAAALPPIGSEEDDLLEAADDRSPRSRLSCQLPFGEELDGIRVTIGL
jgi:2Fe-2S ferredoxin